MDRSIKWRDLYNFTASLGFITLVYGFIKYQLGTNVVTNREFGFIAVAALATTFIMSYMRDRK